MQTDSPHYTGSSRSYGLASMTLTAGKPASGIDNDTLVLNWADVQSITYGGGNNEAGTVTFYGGGTLTFSEIENVVLQGVVDGTAGDDVMPWGYTDAQLQALSQYLSRQR